MAAVKAKGKLVSIVINNEYVKICEITKSGKNVTVHKTVTVPTPEGCYRDGILEEVEILAGTMRAVMNEHRFSANNVVFSISSARLATKEVLIPNVKANKIAKLIEANATEYFPVNMDEYIVQYSVLEKVLVDGQEKIKVMVAAAPAEVVESYYDLAKSLGLKVACIDYVGNSTYQIMKQQIGPEVSLVIQVENDGTIINIFRENVLQLQRTIPYGKSMLVNTVMDKYGLKYDMATEKLQNETLLHSRFDGDEVTESLRYMANNINRVIDYYVSRNRTSIEKAYLIGHATTIKGFNTLISNELNMPINKVDALKNIVKDKKAYVEEATLTSYVTNLGAVVDPVDFIPKSIIESGAKKENTKTLAIAFVASLAVAALFVIVPLVQFIALQAEIANLNKSVKKLSVINGVVDEYYTAKDKYNDIVAFAALTTDNDDSLQDFIDYLEKNMPSDIIIENFSATSGAITIVGKSGSKSSVAKFIQQLQKSSSILDVDVPTITENKDNAGNVEVSFSLSCSYFNMSDISNATSTKSNSKSTNSSSGSSKTSGTTNNSGSKGTSK